jgi:pimeloyl-ACP methyl ester carboxylesterase
MKKAMVFISVILGIYVLICILMFFLQEKVIFFPDKLTKDYRFDFKDPFEEIFIATEDNRNLHGLLFKSDSTKGLIFYLHGNGGCLDRWGDVAELYTGLQYDVFLLDYRGYGKSDGTIESEGQLFEDVQLAYNEMLKLYDEDEVVVLGYSIGTGPATKIASTNNPRMLILQAPYYSLTDMAKHNYPFLPTFLLRYRMETHKYIVDCKMPIVVFHGDADEVIYYGSSLKLKPLLKESDTLITLTGVGHNRMTYERQYMEAVGRFLNH